MTPAKLTREMILSMEAGRELDKLIAEFVMGWYRGVNLNGMEGWMWNQKNFEYATPDTWDKKWVESFWFTPNYSTTWEGMGLVVEKIKDFYGIWDFVIYWNNHLKIWEAGKYEKACSEASFFWDKKSASAATAPLAVCRAALLTTLE